VRGKELKVYTFLLFKKLIEASPIGGYIEI
jgi:hypothetical protein